MKRAIIVGATGLIGSYILKELTASNFYTEVIQMGRRPAFRSSARFINIEDGVLKNNKNNLSHFACDDFFCAIGTTIKKAGAQDNFFKIDYDLTLQMCSMASAAGAKRLFLVTSLGADSESNFFYLQTKGKLEQSVQSLAFTAIHIFRPSLLMGERQERRFLEQLSAPILKSMGMFFLGPFKKFRPIHAEIVAREMLKVATKDKENISEKVVVHGLHG